MRTLHVGLRVSDPARSLPFYTSVGFRVVGVVPDTPLGALTMLRLPDDPFVTLELVHDPRRGNAGPGDGFSHLVVQVDSLSATVAALDRSGIAADGAGPADERSPQTAWLTDPDGYRIELVEWPTGHPVGMTESDFEGS